MSESLSFTYKSVGNVVRLLCTICWEKTASSRDITIWHQRFDNDECDELFESFCAELFPNGAQIDVPEIELITKHAGNFLTKDSKALDYAVAYDKRALSSWVYFKPDKRVIEAPYGYHTRIVQEILEDFFKDFDEVDEDYVERFVKENFEIRSDNLTVEMIAKDCKRVALVLTARSVRRKHESRN